MDRGVIVDIETTGLDDTCDKIIEVGLLQFAVNDQRQLFITKTYGALEQVDVPLSDEICQLTGLSDELLAGQKIDWELVRHWCEDASVVIAHNAPFDRKFLLRHPKMAGCAAHWACSMHHIDWKAKGFSSQRLNYLAADHGFINPFAHRAVFDCATTYRLISPYLEELMTHSYEPMLRLYAVQSAFEAKDLLKANNYRWNPEKRCWYKDIFAKDKDREVSFLSEKIYLGSSRHVEESVSIWDV